MKALRKSQLLTLQLSIFHNKDHDVLLHLLQSIPRASDSKWRPSCASYQRWRLLLKNKDHHVRRDPWTRMLRASAMKNIIFVFISSMKNLHLQSCCSSTYSGEVSKSSETPHWTSQCVDGVCIRTDDLCDPFQTISSLAAAVSFEEERHGLTTENNHSYQENNESTTWETHHTGKSSIYSGPGLQWVSKPRASEMIA